MVCCETGKCKRWTDETEQQPIGYLLFTQFCIAYNLISIFTILRMYFHLLHTTFLHATHVKKHECYQHKEKNRMFQKNKKQW